MIFFKHIGYYDFEKLNFLFKIILIEIIALRIISFMSKNLNSNHIENDEFNLNTEESDYKDLVTRLKEIKSIIALLEKKVFK